MHLREERIGEAVHGTLSVVTDGARVCITGSGFLSSADVDTHFRDLRRIVAIGRPLHTRFKVLVDLRASAVQTREITEQLTRESHMIWTPADRVAMVLRAGLAKMQINRVIDGRDYQVFDEIDRAWRWLDQD